MKIRLDRRRSGWINEERLPRRAASSTDEQAKKIPTWIGQNRREKKKKTGRTGKSSDGADKLARRSDFAADTRDHSGVPAADGETMAWFWRG